MIRKRLKRVALGLARRAKGREEKATFPAAPRSEPVEEAPEPPEPAEDLEVDAETALLWSGEEDPPLFLDIREPHELRGGHARGAFLLPMNQVPHRLAELPMGRVVVYCAAGARSYGVAHYLREQGRGEVYSLSRGFPAWVHAGGDWCKAQSDARFSLLQPVRLSEEAAQRHSLEGRPAGTIQEVTESEGTCTYVLALASETHTRIEGLAESDLEAIGRAQSSR